MVSIIPHDITPENLLKLVKKLNKELNTMALNNNPQLKEHYNLIKGKNIKDRKYSFSDKKN